MHRFYQAVPTADPEEAIKSRDEEEKLKEIFQKNDPKNLLKEIDNCIRLLRRKRYSNISLLSTSAFALVLIAGAITLGMIMHRKKGNAIVDIANAMNQLQQNWEVQPAWKQNSQNQTCASFTNSTLSDFADSDNGCGQGMMLQYYPETIMLVLPVLCEKLLKEFCNLSFDDYDAGFSQNGWIAWLVLMPLLLVGFEIAFLAYSLFKNKQMEQYSMRQVQDYLTPSEVNQLKNLYQCLGLTYDDQKTFKVMLRELQNIKLHALGFYKFQTECKNAFYSLAGDNQQSTYAFFNSKQARNIAPLIMQFAALEWKPEEPASKEEKKESLTI